MMLKEELQEFSGIQCLSRLVSIWLDIDLWRWTQRELVAHPKQLGRIFLGASRRSKRSLDQFHQTDFRCTPAIGEVQGETEKLSERNTRYTNVCCSEVNKKLAPKNPGLKHVSHLMVKRGVSPRTIVSGNLKFVI